MRLQKLELICYGKFAGKVIDFPRAEKDFHLIVGPNEAGKSTIRTAIAELLFGMPRSSSMGFLHPQSELRLGAEIESAVGKLIFHRTKATKNPLRSPSDSVMPDDVLVPFIGTVDKAFFEQMFGLDHTQLIKGGQNILDASRDVGQILFQSAAGISSLGSVRDALVEEANRLWAPRKSGDRAYYIGLQRLDEANAELKDAVVRTKSWSEAHNASGDVEERVRAEQEMHQELEKKRNRLERVRRTAPYLTNLRAREVELKGLGEVIDFPADAASQLSAGQAELSASEQILNLRQGDVALLQAELEQIVVDDALLSLKKDIEGLEEMRHRCRDHQKDLLLRNKDVSVLLEEVKATSAQLDWPQEEDAVRALLPTMLALKTVSNLIRDRGALEQAATSDASAVQKKRQEIARIEGRLTAIPVTEVSAKLKSAVSTAQTLRHTAAKQRSLVESMQAAEKDLGTALQALAPWRRLPDELATMTLPSAESLANSKAEHQSLISACRLAEQRLEEAQGLVRKTELEIEQYSRGHRIVTPSEVKTARSDRDEAWSAVKTGKKTLDAGALIIDTAIQYADELVDVQLSSVTESAELQSLQNRLEREKADVERLQETLHRRNQEISQFDDVWTSKATAMGLDGLLLENITSWLARRDAALAAAALHESRKRELASEKNASDEAHRQLFSLLNAAKFSVSADIDIDALCSIAESYVSESEANAVQRAALSVQLEQSKQELTYLCRAESDSQEAYEGWKKEWEAAISKAKLDGCTASVATVEAAVELVDGIHEKLNKVQSIRRDRIETMQADLARFQDDADRLARELDETLVGVEHIDISKELGRRLVAANTAKQEAERIRRELDTARTGVKKAQEQVASAEAQLQPLFRADGVKTAEALFPLIERSDKKRGLLAAIETAKHNLAVSGDGMTLDEIAAEVDSIEASTLQVNLSEVINSLSASVKKQAELATEKAKVEQSLAAISGHANAAIAEAKRQEALAMMADAAERYIKVATAAKLLRWAIDQYRDQKQGPMLSRAGAFFSQLTLGGFKRLVVDYEKEPLALTAIRTDGQRVEISGMSEGTRDQLYLALRLAALELHLGQAKALPFVADDLFVNFDDDRAMAGLSALAELSKQTQIVFLSHHEHLVPIVQKILGSSVNIVQM